MLISFSGAQSSGKSTLLSKCEELLPHWNFVPEVTRYVLKEYDLPINEEGTDLTQIMILSEHLRNVYRKYEKNAPVILDRCTLDGIVYTHWLCNNKGVNLSVFSHANWVFEKTIGEYDIIFYTSPYEVPVVDDGERSVNIKFRDEIISLFERYLKFVPNEKIVYLRGTVDERMNIIKTTLKNNNLIDNL